VSINSTSAISDFRLSQDDVTVLRNHPFDNPFSPVPLLSSSLSVFAFATKFTRPFRVTFFPNSLVTFGHVWVTSEPLFSFSPAPQLLLPCNSTITSIYHFTRHNCPGLYLQSLLLSTASPYRKGSQRLPHLKAYPFTRSQGQLLLIHEYLIIINRLSSLEHHLAENEPIFLWKKEEALATIVLWFERRWLKGERHVQG
jgi:hypothetical protein